MTNYRTTKDRHVTGWGGNQIITHEGKCLACGRNVYAIADAATPDQKEDPDPRGHINAYHARRSISASEYDKCGPDVLICWDCGNTREKYTLAMLKTKAIWHDSDSCDYGEDESKPCYRLDLGGGSGAFLCRKHWATEMHWRAERNAELEPSAQFDILPWPGA